jgi:hypothetical protein
MVLNGARFIIFTFEWRSFSLITVEIKSSIIISFSSAGYLYYKIYREHASQDSEF